MIDVVRSVQQLTVARAPWQAVEGCFVGPVLPDFSPILTDHPDGSGEDMTNVFARFWDSIVCPCREPGALGPSAVCHGI